MPDAKEKLDCFQQRQLSVIVMRAMGTAQGSLTGIPVYAPYSDTTRTGEGKQN
jgi:hypothetical protein